MKKRLIGVLVFSTLFFTACSKDIDVLNTKIKNEKVLPKKELNIKGDIDIAAFFNNKLLYSYNSLSQHNNVDDEYHLLDISNNNHYPVGKVEDAHIKSEDIYVANNNDVYLCPSVYKDGRLSNVLFKLDISQGLVKYISSYTNINNSVNFNKLNNNEFLISKSMLSNDGSICTYYINKFNSKDNYNETIIQTTYDAHKSTGKIINKVSVNKNLINAYTVEQNSNQKKYFIDIYEQSGKLKQRMHLDDFEQYLTTQSGEIDSVVDFNAFSNFIYFYTSHGKCILFENVDNNLKKIDLGALNNLELIDTKEETLDHLLSKYIYFFDKENHCVYSFNLQTHKLTHLDIGTHDESVYSCVMNKYGDLIVKVEDDTKSSADHLYYKYYLLDL